MSMQREQQMFAVIASGGKQHRVVEGEVLRLEKLNADVGGTIDFPEVLMVGEGNAVQIGKPFVSGSKVTAVVLQHSKAKKIEVIKFKRRKGYRRKQGHRQAFTEVKITGISG